MSVATAAVTIRESLDRAAKTVQTVQDIFPTSNDYWVLYDAAADETFENRVFGSDMTALDTLCENGMVMDYRFRSLFTNWNSYFSLDQGLTGNCLLGSFLDANVRWRVPFEAAELLRNGLGEPGKLPAKNVFPKGTRPADVTNPATYGMWKFGDITDTTYTPDDGAIDTDDIVGAAILMINMNTTLAVTSLVVRAYLQAEATYEDITVVLASASQYAQTILGEGAVEVGGAAAAQADVDVKTSATQFNAGEYVLLWQSDTVQEIAQIASIASETLTMEENLINSYSENDLVIPLFTNVDYVSGSIDGAETIDFYAYPDRIIAL